MQSPKEIATAPLYVVQSRVSELCSGARGMGTGVGVGVLHVPVILVLQSTAWTVGCCVPEV